MLIPKARGSLSAALFATLPSLEPDDALSPFATTADDEADEQIALWALYELHYRGFEDADAALEWHPDLLRLRRSLELSLEQRLLERYTEATVPNVGPTLADSLFARALVALGLDDRYGAYVDEVPTEVLEQNNAMTLFGLHRRMRGAAVGHL